MSFDGVPIALEEAKDLMGWIDTRLHGLELNGDHRHRIPAQLFHLVLEHHKGIICLLSAGIYGSGCALVRCVFECFVRGTWLHHCATDEEIETFVDKDYIPLKLGPMIEAIEQTPDFSQKFLSQVKAQAWGPMNGYSHGGIHQISRRMQGAYVEASFDGGEILEVIQFSGMIALLALNRIARLVGDENLEAEVNCRMAPPAV